MPATPHPTPSSAALPAVLAAIDSLEGTLKLAEALLGHDRCVDLEGLDAEVTALCAATLALPPEQQGAAGRGLRRLRGRVERLQRLGGPPGGSPHARAG